MLNKLLIPLAVLVVLLCSSCAMNPELNLEFEDSHQLFLERTMAQLDLVDAVAGAVPAGKSICCVSMESEKTGDAPLVALVEDQFLKQLVGAGYRVLERDDDMIRRMIREGSSDRFQYTLFPEGTVVSGASSSVQGGNWGSFGLQASGTTVVQSAGRDTVLVVPTRLAVADYIVAYRVLECGLVYRKSEDRAKVKREAQIRLHVRIHEAATGSLVFADNIESRALDQIPRLGTPWLADYHYKFYGADFPNQQGQPNRSKLVGGVTAKKSTGDSNPR